MLTLQQGGLPPDQSTLEENKALPSPFSSGSRARAQAGGEQHADQLVMALSCCFLSAAGCLSSHFSGLNTLTALLGGRG